MCRGASVGNARSRAGSPTERRNAVRALGGPGIAGLMTRGRLILGAMAFAVAMVVAVLRPGEERPTQVVSAAATTSTTTVPTTTPVPTTIVMVNGVPFPIPIPPLPPGVSIEPQPGDGVLNIHCRLESINGRPASELYPGQGLSPPVTQDPRCAKYDNLTPEQVQEILRPFGVTTTTKP